jgi:hypothetical protein
LIISIVYAICYLWGMVSILSLIFVGIIDSLINLSKQILGVIMACGIGGLISAVAYELIFEASKSGKGTGYPAYIFLQEPLLFCSVFFLLKIRNTKL